MKAASGVPQRLEKKFKREGMRDEEGDCQDFRVTGFRPCRKTSPSASWWTSLNSVGVSSAIIRNSNKRSGSDISKTDLLRKGPAELAAIAQEAQSLIDKGRTRRRQPGAGARPQGGAGATNQCEPRRGENPGSRRARRRSPARLSIGSQQRWRSRGPCRSLRFHNAAKPAPEASV